MENHGLLCPGTARKSQGGQQGLPPAGSSCSRRVQWGRCGATRNEAVGRGTFGAEKVHLQSSTQDHRSGW